MITYIEGTLTTFTEFPPRAVVLTSGGVGYQVSLPVFVYESLKRKNIEPGANAKFHIFYSVSERQPMPVLVGFESPEERAFFEQFVQVEGIGPTKAAAALVMPVPTIARAIETSDATTLQAMPGIGARAAQKIVATLKGKVTEAAMLPDGTETDTVAPVSSARHDVIGILVSLGYRNAEAATIVDDVLTREPELADDEQRLLQEALRANPTATAATMH